MARTRAALLITVTEREARVQGSLVRGTRSSVPQVGCDDAQIPLEGLTRRVQEQPCRLLHEAVPAGIDGWAGQHEALPVSPSTSGLAASQMVVSAPSSAVCAQKLVSTTTILRSPPTFLVRSVSTYPGFSALAVTGLPLSLSASAQVSIRLACFVAR
jgi:hypothetical protein